LFELNYDPSDFSISKKDKISFKKAAKVEKKSSPVPQRVKL